MKLVMKDNYIFLISLILLIIGMVLPYTFVAFIITFIFFLLAIFKPKQALLILIIYTPLRPLLITYQDALKGITDAIIFGALISVVITYLYKGKWQDLFKFKLFEWAFFIFLVIGSLSALMTGVDLVAIIFQIRAFLLMYIIYYVVIRLDITTKDVKKFIWLTLSTAIVLIIHGLIEKLSARELLLPLEWQEAELNDRNKLRIYGLINNPNHLAVYMTFTFITTLYLRHIQKNFKWIIDVILVFLAGVFLLTDSKGMLLLITVLAVLYIVMIRNWRKIAHIVLILVVAQFLVVEPVQYAVNEFNNGENDSQQGDENVGKGKKDKTSVDQLGGSLAEIVKQEGGVGASMERSTNSGRVMIIKNGMKVFIDNPIIGSGFGTYGDSATKSFGTPIADEYDIRESFYSDGQYTQIIAQTGILGVLTFAVFLLSMLYMVWKKRKSNPFANLGVLLVLFSYGGGLIYNIWEMDIFTLFFFMILAFIMGDRKFDSYLDNDKAKLL
ncbi:O-antigen ligase family protein [Aquibacillus rhizosphaerae]|uniref:O-antigen ligase family protein n=1 Tax=Aquibacillus rhizosphaerae TaxID=3051431 RepID=A0ABT7KZE4_9BACI|nr:O-antigen ligase family protein [Aquibacillus sp. LR5S19]MDL4838887.1 O-antigen ligase family protein [Aquibacillus sp. LR5S19]